MSALVDGLVTGLGFSTAQAGNVAAANVYGRRVERRWRSLIVTHIRWRPVALCVAHGPDRDRSGFDERARRDALTTVRFSTACWAGCSWA
jgi:hypothetical protein